MIVWKSMTSVNWFEIFDGEKRPKRMSWIGIGGPTTLLFTTSKLFISRQDPSSATEHFSVLCTGEIFSNDAEIGCPF